MLDFLYRVMSACPTMFGVACMGRIIRLGRSWQGARTR
jgi:hypothetical protein